MWNIVWYGWHVGALHVKGLLATDVFSLVSDLISPFVVISFRRKYPPLFYYERKGRVLFVNKRLVGSNKLLLYIQQIFILGRVLQHLADEPGTYIRRVMEIIAKVMLVFLPISWYLGLSWLGWNIFFLTVLVMFISYFDIDGYIRALIMLSYTGEISEELENHLYTLRFYPFSLLLVVRLPIDLLYIIGGIKKRG